MVTGVGTSRRGRRPETDPRHPASPDPVRRRNGSGVRVFPEERGLHGDCGFRNPDSFGRKRLRGIHQHISAHASDEETQAARDPQRHSGQPVLPCPQDVRPLRRRMAAAASVNASAIPCRVVSRIRRQSPGQGRESDPGFGTNVTEVLIGNSRNQRNQALDPVIVSSPVALKVGPDCYPCCTGAANLPANTDWSQMLPRTFSGSLPRRFAFHPDSWWQSSQRAWNRAKPVCRRYDDVRDFGWQCPAKSNRVSRRFSPSLLSCRGPRPGLGATNRVQRRFRLH